MTEDTASPPSAQLPPNVWEELQPLSAIARSTIASQFTLPYGVFFLNVRGDRNVGGMIRNAALLGCRKFYLAGRHRWDRRHSVGSQFYIDISRVPDILNVTIDTHHDIDCDCGSCKIYDAAALLSWLPAEYSTVVFIEQGGVSVEKLAKELGTSCPLFILGNETNGIPSAFIRKIKETLGAERVKIATIPQFSIMRSLNVASAGLITIWEFYKETRHKRLDAIGTD